PDADGPVQAMVVSADGTKLYVGGDFDHIGVRAVSKLARIDLATGAVDPTFQPGVRGGVRALALAGDRLYVGGVFNYVTGAATGAALPQQWKTGRPIFDLTVSPADGETVFASAGGSGGQVYAFRPDQPKGPLWATWVDGDAPGLAASMTTVYLMGHYDYAG